MDLFVFSVESEFIIRCMLYITSLNLAFDGTFQMNIWK